MPLIRAEFKGRDSIEILNDESGAMPKLKVIGCTKLLWLVRKYQVQFGADLRLWPLPQGAAHEELLLKEAILKLQNKWQYPYEHAEICHCRSVPTEKVDQAILGGAHTGEMVSRQTGASTACGTCRSDVVKIIDYRKTTS